MRPQPVLTSFMPRRSCPESEGEGALVAFDRHLAQNPEDTVARGYRDRARERVDAAHGLENF